MTKRIGLYGGTFDPIHFGHLHLANELLARHELDEVWFIPAQISPHKIDAPPISAEHRLNMLQRAIQGLPQFKVVDVELHRDGPSYTIETINEILDDPSLQHHQFFLLITDEIVPHLSQWRSIDQIIEKIPLLVGKRSSKSPAATPSGKEKLDAAVKKGLTDMPVLEIEARTVRDRIKRRLSCRHLVPGPVLAYLYENQLYT